MADTKISALTARTAVAGTDEFPSLAGGANFRSPLSSLPAYLATATFAAGTLTDSAPKTLTQTWNDAADTFKAVVVNVTDTASAAASLLMDLQKGGVSQFTFSKSGELTLTGTTRASANNTSFIQQRNAANSAYVDLLKLDASDRAYINAPMVVEAARASSGRFLNLNATSFNSNDALIEASFPTLTGNAYAFLTSGAASGTITHFLQNTNAAAGGTRMYLQVGGTTGDPYTLCEVSGGASWASGIDNSVTGDPFVFSATTNPSTTYALKLATDGVVSVGLVMSLPAKTVASLPTGAEGMVASVSDSTTNVWGATITGGGAIKALAYFNGTNWTVAGN